MLAQAGPVYIFSHRLDGHRHRTRQAVYKDLQRAAKLLRLGKGIGTHSMRKTYARTLLESGKSLSAIQRKLLHSSPLITTLYAMADVVDLR